MWRSHAAHAFRRMEFFGDPGGRDRPGAGTFGWRSHQLQGIPEGAPADGLRRVSRLRVLLAVCEGPPYCGTRRNRSGEHTRAWIHEEPRQGATDRVTRPCPRTCVRGEGFAVWMGCRR